jgi:hypothetical protein
MSSISEEIVDVPTGEIAVVLEPNLEVKEEKTAVEEEEKEDPEEDEYSLTRKGPTRAPLSKMKRMEKEASLSGLLGGLGQAYSEVPDLFGEMSYYTLGEGQGISYGEYLIKIASGATFGQTTLGGDIRRIETLAYVDALDEYGFEAPDEEPMPTDPKMTDTQLKDKLRAGGVTVLSGVQRLNLPLASGDHVEVGGEVKAIARGDRTIQLSTLGDSGTYTFQGLIENYPNYVTPDGKWALGPQPRYNNTFATGPPDKEMYTAFIGAYGLAWRALDEAKEETPKHAALQAQLNSLLQSWWRIVEVSKKYYMGAAGAGKLLDRFITVQKSAKTLQSMPMLYTSKNRRLKSQVIKNLAKLCNDGLAFSEKAARAYNRGERKAGRYNFRSITELTDALYASKVLLNKGTPMMLGKALKSSCSIGSEPPDLSMEMVEAWTDALSSVGQKLCTKFPVDLRGHPVRVIMSNYSPGYLASDEGGEDDREPLPFDLIRLNVTAEAGPLYGKGRTLGAPDVGPSLPFNAANLLMFFHKYGVDGLAPLPEPVRYIVCAWLKRKVEAAQRKKGTRGINVISADVAFVWRIFESLCSNCAPSFFTDIDCRSLAKVYWSDGGLMRFIKRVRYYLKKTGKKWVLLRYADNLFIVTMDRLVSFDGRKFEASHTKASVAMEMMRRLNTVVDVVMKKMEDGPGVRLMFGDLISGPWLQYILSMVQTIGGVAVIGSIQAVNMAMASGLPSTFSLNDCLMGYCQSILDNVIPLEGVDFSQFEPGPDKEPPPPIEVAANLCGVSLTLENNASLVSDETMVDLDLLGMGMANVKLADLDLQLAVLDSERFYKQMVYHKAYLGYDKLKDTWLMFPFTRYMIGMSCYLLRGYMDPGISNVLKVYIGRAIKDVTRLVRKRGTTPSIARDVLNEIVRNYFSSLFDSGQGAEKFNRATKIVPGRAPSEVPNSEEEDDALVQKMVDNLLEWRMPSLHFAMQVNAPHAAWYMVPRIVGVKSGTDALKGRTELKTRSQGIVNIDGDLEGKHYQDKNVDGLPAMTISRLSMPESIRLSNDFISHGRLMKYFIKYRQSSRFRMRYPLSSAKVYKDFFDITSPYGFMVEAIDKSALEGLSVDEMATYVEGLHFSTKFKANLMAYLDQNGEENPTVAANTISRMRPQLPEPQEIMSTRRRVSR